MRRQYTKLRRTVGRYPPKYSDENCWQNRGGLIYSLTILFLNHMGTVTNIYELLKALGLNSCYWRNKIILLYGSGIAIDLNSVSPPLCSS